jgi:F-type H+-transporting ATPase subunit alpha
MKRNWFDLSSSSKFQVSDKTMQGVVVKISDAVVTIKGLSSATSSEMIKINIDKFNNFVYAMVLNLSSDKVEAIILGDESKVKEGSSAELCNFPVRIPVDFRMLGRVVDPLGNFLDTSVKFRDKKKKLTYKKVDIKAPGIIERQSVFQSMKTGIKAVDSMVPIGCGQRELIIGDRQTGKTAVAVDAIINQGNYFKSKSLLKIFPLDIDYISTFKFQTNFVKKFLLKFD